MDKQTVTLLKECNAGCKMAVGSIDRIKEFLMNAELEQTLTAYKEQHKKLEEESSKLLAELGERGQQPDKIASAFSWITTEVKLLVKDDSTQIAKILMNGCNMGIQSISECMNKCPDASHGSISLAKKLVKCEEKLMEDMKKYL
ncbi:MAG: hypothetical protein HFG83_02360 [Dorea sp.]|jgi:hypothetical protein|nr:hypothetical protein [Dorea sp.]MCI9452669.1 hypothetical protein [Dorea sp.]